MNHLRLILNPIIIFIFSITAVCLSLIFYIYWYVEASAGLKRVLEKAKIDPDQVLASQTWVVILVLSILVGIILMGIFIIFVYNQKTYQLYRLQRNFIDNFTHELKTPVTSLKLYLETFKKHELPRKDQIKYIEYMVQDVERLSRNITRILDLARIESKIYKDRFVIVDVVKVIRNFVEKNSHVFNGSEITIQNPSGRAIFYPISISLFDMLLMNLFTNAIKYNESTIPVLNVIFKPGVRGLRICFEDNGIGIPRPEMKKIFRKFYQSGRSRDMTAKSTGIGLHMVDSIARIHKGRIMAASKGRNKGSVFSLVLPFSPTLAYPEGGLP